MEDDSHTEEENAYEIYTITDNPDRSRGVTNTEESRSFSVVAPSGIESVTE